MVTWVIVLACILGWWWVGRQICKATVRSLGSGYSMSGSEGFFLPIVWPILVFLWMIESDKSCLDRFKIGE